MSKLFLPRFEFSKRPVSEWLDRVKHTEGQDAIDALWCVYWANDRSPAVLERLEELYSKSADRLAREIDVVLTEWDVPHAPRPPRWMPEQSGGPITPDELDRVVGEALDWPPNELAPVLGTVAWHAVGTEQVYFSPSGLLAVPMRALQSPTDALIPALDSADRVQQAEAAVSLAMRRQEIPRALQKLLARDAADPESIRKPEMITWGGIGRDDSMRHVGYGAGWGWIRLASAVQAWPIEQSTRMAISWIRAYAGSAALDATRPDDHSRDRDLWPHESRHLKPYEAGGTTALTATSPAARTYALVRNLEDALARGEDSGPALDELMAFVGPDYTEAGAIGPMDRYMDFLNWLETHEFSDPRITQWCLAIVGSHWPFSPHLTPAANYLRRQKLDAREQAILCRYSELGISYNPMQEPWMPAALVAQQGKAAIELAAYARDQAQLRQDLDYLDAVFAVAKPSQADSMMLLAALQRGAASERLRALRIVDERGLDTTALRTAVGEALTDVDSQVRASATALARSRGW